MKTFHVYFLASKKRGTLYIGVTNDIARRVEMHRLGAGSRFELIERDNPDWFDLYRSLNR